MFPLQLLHDSIPSSTSGTAIRRCASPHLILQLELPLSGDGLAEFAGQLLPLLDPRLPHLPQHLLLSHFVPLLVVQRLAAAHIIIPAHSTSPAACHNGIRCVQLLIVVLRFVVEETGFRIFANGCDCWGVFLLG